jgi:hypothetical protein
MKYYVTKKEKSMSDHKTVITRGNPERKIVGYVGLTGNIILGLSSSMNSQNNCVLNPETGRVAPNGSAFIDELRGWREEDTIYEGDSVTIQF